MEWTLPVSKTYGRKLVNHDPFSNVIYALQIDVNADENEAMQERHQKSACCPNSNDLKFLAAQRR